MEALLLLLLPTAFLSFMAFDFDSGNDNDDDHDTGGDNPGVVDPGDDPDDEDPVEEPGVDNPVDEPGDEEPPVDEPGEEEPVIPGGDEPVDGAIRLAPGDGDHAGGDEDDHIIAEDGYFGVVDGGNGNDRLEATGDRDGSGFPVWGEDGLLRFHGDHVLLRGGAGADTIVASGDLVEVDGGDGEDLIDVRGLRGGLVHVGVGDAVIADDGTRAVWQVAQGASLDLSATNPDVDYGHEIIAAEGAAIEGSHAGDNIIASGLNTIRAGGGDDAVDGAQSFGAQSSLYDTLDGGEGNDTLAGGAGDVLIGGEGEDFFAVWTGAEAQTRVMDMTEGERLEVTFDMGEVSWYTLDARDVQDGLELEVAGAGSVLLSGDVSDLDFCVTEHHVATGQRLSYDFHTGAPVTDPSPYDVHVVIRVPGYE